ncbi:MAG: thrombospondin type 3 repeat-containing protein [Candidatus Zixiibacteriota bacterium]
MAGNQLEGFKIKGANSSSIVGVRCSNSFLAVIDCKIEGNRNNGLWVINGSSLTMTGTIFAGNQTDNTGAGLLCDGFGRVLLYGNRFENNLGPSGAAITLRLGDYAACLHNLVYSNSATGPGGGLFIDNVDTLVFRNNTIDSNTANAAAGIYLSAISVLSFLNNIVSRNLGSVGGGLEYGSGIVPELQDFNDVWSNTPIDYAGSGNAPGPNSLSLDPLFLAGSPFDHRLQPSSPCIDAGSPDLIYNDPDGTRSDIGAYPNMGDRDFDLVPDSVDNCVFDPNPGQGDVDGDSVGDACDNCVSIPNSLQEDVDGDIVGDACDNCRYAGNPSQSDTDADGPGDACDNCPTDHNPNQTNSDGDALGDVCDPCPLDASNDVDSDGICGNVDNCPSVANANQLDTDDDGIGDACDNCPNRYNPLQEETDGDGVADSCDNCPTVYNASQLDADGDGIGNVCDPCLLDPQNDPDNDGICWSADNCPDVYNPDQSDTNGNSIGDVCDCSCPWQADFDESGAVDAVDLAVLIDAVFFGGPDPQDPLCPDTRGDFNSDGVTDAVDLAVMIDYVFFGGSGPGEPCAQ